MGYEIKMSLNMTSINYKDAAAFYWDVETMNKAGGGGD